MIHICRKVLVDGDIHFPILNVITIVHGVDKEVFSILQLSTAILCVLHVWLYFIY